MQCSPDEIRHQILDAESVLKRLDIEMEGIEFDPLVPSSVTAAYAKVDRLSERCQLLMSELRFLADSSKLPFFFLDQALDFQNLHGADLLSEQLQLRMARLKVRKLGVQFIRTLPMRWAFPIVTKRHRFLPLY
ncbi:hypothetical protein PSJE_08680 [Pseudomonas jessenii]|jgi:hypothetical protein|uniref:Uncharacterized protein n=1 Tax=Pseudomonas jessenii TaxID=77298 RepID=A0A231GPK9_PSEJE|nr:MULTISPECIES: hypothetical protein [Pseudomonas]MBV7523566.1 hypothetical protein [Pseudomonas sp. PDM29]OXR38536.1 hypothetical protein PSJE_08680 [Pseudomonas jessenii]SEC11572.1 hypothetical protein SAMN04490187_3228 [Pseudomonas jessenii]